MKKFVFIITLLLLTTYVNADVFILTNGRSVNGKLIVETNTHYRITPEYDYNGDYNPSNGHVILRKEEVFRIIERSSRETKQIVPIYDDSKYFDKRQKEYERYCRRIEKREEWEEDRDILYKHELELMEIEARIAEAEREAEELYYRSLIRSSVPQDNISINLSNDSESTSNSSSVNTNDINNKVNAISQSNPNVRTKITPKISTYSKYNNNSEIGDMSLQNSGTNTNSNQNDVANDNANTVNNTDNNTNTNTNDNRNTNTVR